MSVRMTVTFEFGLENAPDSPWGMDRITVEPHGRFTYENRQSGRVLQTRRGRIAPLALEQIARDLSNAQFPAVPDHAKPPGGNYVTIIVSADGTAQEAFMRGSAAERFDGYGPLLRRVRQWAKFLRGAADVAPPPELDVDSEDSWAVIGLDVFAREEYPISTHATEAEARAAAEKCLGELDVEQPPETSGGQDGLQDRLFVRAPNGKRYRVVRAS